MKSFENFSLFHFTWDQVAQGLWMRYPNPYSKHVLTEDTISREVRDGKLYSKRIVTKTSIVPKWGQGFVLKNVVSIVEESVVDPKEKLIITYTKNAGLGSIMSVFEKVEYKTSQENSNWTIAERKTTVDSSVIGFKAAITAFGLEKYKINIKKMTMGFNYVLCVMFPQTPGAKEELANLMSKGEKLRDVAKTASELAKSKANSMFASCEPKEV